MYWRTVKFEPSQATPALVPVTVTVSAGMSTGTGLGLPRTRSTGCAGSPGASGNETFPVTVIGAGLCTVSWTVVELDRPVAVPETTSDHDPTGVAAPAVTVSTVEEPATGFVVKDAVAPAGRPLTVSGIGWLTNVACSYAEALAEATLDEGRRRLVELFEKLPPLVDTFTTCEYYSEYRLRVVEAVVWAVTDRGAVPAGGFVP